MILPNLMANWPAPASIKALTTTRAEGYSVGPYASNNVALHVGDNPQHVEKNRRQMASALALPAEPAWLEQTHSTICVVVEDDSNRIADAAITRRPSTPLVIMTGDCLPILLCNLEGNEIAGIHAGWRGLANGIVENTLNKMHSNPHQLLAWMGPAICNLCYEVGTEVRDQYLSHYPYASNAFHEQESRITLDLATLAELVLNKAGVTQIYKSNACTHEQQSHFFSYRREGQTGRMANLIWIHDTM